MREADFRLGEKLKVDNKMDLNTVTGIENFKNPLVNHGKIFSDSERYSSTQSQPMNSRSDHELMSEVCLASSAYTLYAHKNLLKRSQL